MFQTENIKRSRSEDQLFSQVKIAKTDVLMSKDVLYFLNNSFVELLARVDWLYPETFTISHLNDMNFVKVHTKDLIENGVQEGNDYYLMVVALFERIPCNALSSFGEKNELLVNVFSKWSQWVSTYITCEYKYKTAIAALDDETVHRENLNSFDALLYNHLIYYPTCKVKEDFINIRV